MGDVSISVMSGVGCHSHAPMLGWCPAGPAPCYPGPAGPVLTQLDPGMLNPRPHPYCYSTPIISLPVRLGAICAGQTLCRPVGRVGLHRWAAQLPAKGQPVQGCSSSSILPSSDVAASTRSPASHRFTRLLYEGVFDPQGEDPTSLEVGWFLVRRAREARTREAVEGSLKLPLVGPLTGPPAPFAGSAACSASCPSIHST
jgi:hypothetical protein